MNSRVAGFTKWQLRNALKGALIFYFFLLAFLAFVGVLTAQAGSGGSTSGLDVNEVGFIFVLGIVSFGETFRFSQANCFSRRAFFLSTLATFGMTAAVLAVSSRIVEWLLSFAMSYQSLVVQMYHTESIVARLLFSFSLMLFAACGGQLIALLYYRSNTVQKWLISLSPILVITGLNAINRSMHGKLAGMIFRGLLNALGFANPNAPNPSIAALSFFLGALVCGSLSYLLLRRAPARSDS